MPGAAPASDPRSWDDVLEILSSLITFKARADGKGWRDAFENMPLYMQRVGLTPEDLNSLNVIHVAGTKGKGSTCAMVESMLRSCGHRTGLYTSPHLCDVRERVRIDGRLVSKQVFAQHFWDVYDRLLATCGEDTGMPGYFRFITLLGLRIFVSQKVDVVVLEVGIGGRLDATNIVPAPVVCGITSLGFDHMELLGDTLPKIAVEKAGILKAGVPAFSVRQPDDAMAALVEAARAAGAPLALPRALRDYRRPGGEPLLVGLRGEHQEVNAALAVQLAATWEAAAAARAERGAGAGGAGAAGAAARVAQLQAGVLPEAYALGLQQVQWPGRSQVIQDPSFLDAASGTSRLIFYLDGAHTPESMDTCAAWFAEVAAPPAATAGPATPLPAPAANGAGAAAPPPGVGAWHSPAAGAAEAATGGGSGGGARQRVLVFNCMKERDPWVLLPQLRAALQRQGVLVQHALFVPPDSNYGFLASARSGERAAAAKLDLSWQLQLREVWAAAQVQVSSGSSDGSSSGGGGGEPVSGCSAQLPAVPQVPGEPPSDSRCGAVVPSVDDTLAWLRDCVRQHPQLQLQVLVTGSLYLVGDMLRALGCPP